MQNQRQNQISKNTITSYQNGQNENSSQKDIEESETSSQGRSGFAISFKSKGIKKCTRQILQSDDETCSNSKRFTVHQKEKKILGKIKPNRIPLNRLQQKMRQKPVQNFLLSPQALQRSQSKIHLSLLFQHNSNTDENSGVIFQKENTITIQDDIQNQLQDDIIEERINGLKNIIFEHKDSPFGKPLVPWTISDVERDTQVDDLVFSDSNSIQNVNELSSGQLSSSVKCQNISIKSPCKYGDYGPKEEYMRCGTNDQVIQGQLNILEYIKRAQTDEEQRCHQELDDLLLGDDEVNCTEVPSQLQGQADSAGDATRKQSVDEDLARCRSFFSKTFKIGETDQKVQESDNLDDELLSNRSEEL